MPRDILDYRIKVGFMCVYRHSQPFLQIFSLVFFSLISNLSPLMVVVWKP